MFLITIYLANIYHILLTCSLFCSSFYFAICDTDI